MSLLEIWYYSLTAEDLIDAARRQDAKAKRATGWRKPASASLKTSFPKSPK